MKSNEIEFELAKEASEYIAGNVLSNEVDGEQSADEENVEDMTALSAITRILKYAKGSGLSEEFWTKCDASLEFLGEPLGLCDYQVLLLLLLVDSGRPMMLADIAEYLGCPRIQMIAYNNNMDEMVMMHYVSSRDYHDSFGMKVTWYSATKRIIDILCYDIWEDENLAV